ncbi:MAG: DMT family transporter [Bacteroidales bacterium]|nr:DMT family transporter [Bacteroidales bacterium]
MNLEQMNDKLKGAVCGIVSAMCYGINPIGKLLYADGISTDTLLLYRFSLAAVVFAIAIVVTKGSFRLTKREGLITLGLGLLFGASSMTLYYSFRQMATGVASTLLFLYPLLVAIIMAVCFRERVGWRTLLAIVVAFIGIAILNYGGDDNSLNLVGGVLVFVSALTYAIYIVILNRSLSKVSPLTLSFYVALCCVCCNLVHSLIDPTISLQLLTAPKHLLVVGALAIFPTVVALLLLAVSVRKIGSTPTAILGALEPLTAVLIGVLLYDESFTFPLAVGIVLILASVLMVVLPQQKPA